MEGGKLIHKSVSSCVFQPNIPCDSNEKVSMDKLSKVMFLGLDDNERPMESVKREITMNKKVQSIKNHKQWSLLYDNHCKAPPQSVMSTYDPEGVMECFQNIQKEKKHYNVDYGVIDNETGMLNGMIGGITLKTHFENTFQDKKQLSSKFYKTMVKIEPLFSGLVELKKKGIVHNDIKWDNIVFHDGRFKYIDFGLSGIVSDTKLFKRRIQQMSNERFYLPYPYDYQLYYLTQKQLDAEFNSINKHLGSDKKVHPYKMNIDIYNDISVFYYTYDLLTQFQEIDKGIGTKKLTEKKILLGIDVYSLGMCLILLVEQYILQGEPYSNEMIHEFMKLFTVMCHPYLETRLTPEQAYKRYKKLIRLYQAKKPRTKYTKKKKQPNKVKQLVKIYKKHKQVKTLRKKNKTQKKGSRN